MVGLSLIVYAAVRIEGVMAIWDFPARLPETFVWSPQYVPGEAIERVRRLPGVDAFSVTTDVDCEIQTAGAAPRSSQPSLMERFLRKLSRPVFVAGEPDKLLSMMKVVFIEGDRAEALEKIKRGGYIIIPPQTARNKNLHVGDRAIITIHDRSAEFEVAGVVQSPALDIAVTAFQAQSYMQFAAASAVLGTRDDLKEKFDLDIVSMFMSDIDLPPTELPPDFDPAHLPDFTSEAAVAEASLGWVGSLPNERDFAARTAPVLREWLMSGADGVLDEEVRDELRRFAKAVRKLAWSSATKRRTREENWEIFRERLVLLKIAQEMDRPDAIIGSVRRLKQEIDVHLKRAMVLATWLPSVMLVVAAIGIGNLMMVSVHLRSRDIAVLRAVGAHRSQIIRLVLAEAITLGLLGSVIGLSLGFHEAYSVNRIATSLIDVTLDFIVPVGTVGLSVALTVGVCLVAGIPPACRAARSDVIAAMQTV
jgi:ABC-type lipoprotein release transport system permease subunit